MYFAKEANPEHVFFFFEPRSGCGALVMLVRSCCCFIVHHSAPFYCNDKNTPTLCPLHCFWALRKRGLVEFLKSCHLLFVICFGGSNFFKKSHAKEGYFFIILETLHWGQFLEPCKNHVEQWNSVIVFAIKQNFHVITSKGCEIFCKLVTWEGRERFQQHMMFPFRGGDLFTLPK